MTSDFQLVKKNWDIVYMIMVSLLNVFLYVPDPIFFIPFYMPIPREAPPEDVLDMFKWFFPMLP